MVSEEIKNVIQQRTADWNVKQEEKDVIFSYATSMLEFCLKQGIVFDQTAGSVFVSHLATLYHRIHEYLDMGLTDEMKAEIEQDLYALENDIRLMTNEYYHAELSDSELFLILTHLGSMRERMKEERNV